MGCKPFLLWGTPPLNPPPDPLKKEGGRGGQGEVGGGRNPLKLDVSVQVSRAKSEIFEIEPAAAAAAAAAEFDSWETRTTFPRAEDSIN